MFLKVFLHQNSLRFGDESKVVSELAILIQKIFIFLGGSPRTSLLYILGELAGGGSGPVAVGVSDM